MAARELSAQVICFGDVMRTAYALPAQTGTNPLLPPTII